MVEFVVRVPENTPPSQQVFLSGEGPTFGNWSARALPLEAWPDQTHRVRLDLPRGYSTNYLATLGRWREVESVAGSERLPRSLTVSGPTIIEIDVADWGRNSLVYHHDFPSSFLPKSRTIIVHLPPGYDVMPERRYPVFYLHDGQNLFDADTSYSGAAWGCDETAEMLARADEIEPIILVGINNTSDRLREYGPRWTEQDRAEDLSQAYGRFLVEEVKPFVDLRYRTLTGPKHTAVGGSSMGGLISLHLCQWYPEVFGMCAAMSPSLWWDGEHFLETLEKSPAWVQRTHFWLDMGGQESATSAGAQAGIRRVGRLASFLVRSGLRENTQFRNFVVPEGRHNEAAWGARFDRVLKFFFGSDS